MNKPLQLPARQNEVASAASKTAWSFETPYALISAVVFIALWQAGTNVFDTPAYVLPSPLAIMRDVLGHWRLLLGETAITAFEVVLGFVISVVVAIPLSVLFTYSRAFERAIYPLVVGSQTVPKVAIAPLFIAWFGFGWQPKIIIVVLVTFFPILINAVVGLKSLNTQTLYLARSMGSSAIEVFWRFRLPNALPSIFAGMKVATVLAVIGAVVAEFVGADNGLGYVIMVATSDMNVARQFAAITLLTVLGVIFFWIIGLAERLVLPWHISIRRDTFSS